MRLRVALILAITAASAAAQVPELRVSLRELTGEAIKNNPDIVAAQKKYEATRQRPTQESSLPDPMISLGYSSVGNPLPGAGLGTQVLANVGVMVSQEVPFPGKLKLKGDMASKEARRPGDQRFHRTRSLPSGDTKSVGGGGINVEVEPPPVCPFVGPL